ncbi:MAG: BadF/BadG/BcrA/BcrD ATPase family protein [Bacteroidota bacterium]
MILLADSGSTKCDWIVYENPQTAIRNIQTKGINPAILGEKAMTEIITHSAELYTYGNDITTIYFFGAGCNTHRNKKKVTDVLTPFFPKATKIVVEEDTMVAVLATTTMPAVICILGTGSNCCYYDGHNIQQRVPAMGYVLMDEGSGNHIGKKLLRSYYYGKMPGELHATFKKAFNMEEAEVIDRLYRSKTPNKYLAEFARFLFEHKTHPFSIGLITQSISEFIENQLLQYHNELKSGASLYFIGSIAYHAQELISAELHQRGLAASGFVRRPITTLIDNLKKDTHFLDRINAC